MTMHATATKASAQADTAQPESADKKTAVNPTPQQIPLWANAVPVIQFSLKINNPNDKYEQEADRVAEQVMRMPEPAVQRKTCACGKAAGPNGMCEDCKRKQLSIQRKATGEATQPAASLIVHQVLQQPGRPLNSGNRRFMESRFDQDFSDVRVHADERAAQSAEAVGARAYAAGRDIVFGADQYAPQTNAGKRLLAHELAHIVQQQRLSPLASPLSQHAPEHHQLEGQAAPSAPAIQASAHPVTVREVANDKAIYRDDDPNSASAQNAGGCYTRNNGVPPSGWAALSMAARGLPDVFNTKSDNVNFRNKAAAQYKVTFTDSSEVSSQVFAYHSGNDDGSEPLFDALTNDAAFQDHSGRAFAKGIVKNTTGQHSENLMHTYGVQMIESLRGRNDVQMFEGYVFTFFAPCDECQGVLDDNVAKSTDPLFVDPHLIPKQWWVDSHCVDPSSGHGFDKAFPPVMPKGGNITPRDVNFEQARRLKQSAGDALQDDGLTSWTKYKIVEEEDEDKDGQEPVAPLREGVPSLEQHHQLVSEWLPLQATTAVPTGSAYKVYISAPVFNGLYYIAANVVPYSRARIQKEASVEVAAYIVGIVGALLTTGGMVGRTGAPAAQKVTQQTTQTVGQQVTQGTGQAVGQQVTQGTGQAVGQQAAQRTGQAVASGVIPAETVQPDPQSMFASPENYYGWLLSRLLPTAVPELPVTLFFVDTGSGASARVPLPFVDDSVPQSLGDFMWDKIKGWVPDGLLNRRELGLLRGAIFFNNPAVIAVFDGKREEEPGAIGSTRSIDEKQYVLVGYYRSKE